MRILSGPGAAPGSGPAWGHEHHRFDVDDPSPFQGGICSRFLYNFCSSVATCVSFVSCCWLLRDCFGGPRDFDPGPPPPPAPRPYSGLWEPGPPRPPFQKPGPRGYPGLPGPPGGPGPAQWPFY